MPATPASRRRNNAQALAAQCGKTLLRLRANQGKTQLELAKRLRMTESMISRLESGKHVPSLRTLCRIADAFGRELEIVFHEHVHADGTRHSHPHHHLDSDHRHAHKEPK